MQNRELWEGAGAARIPPWQLWLPGKPIFKGMTIARRPVTYGEPVSRTTEGFSVATLNSTTIKYDNVWRSPCRFSILLQGATEDLGVAGRLAIPFASYPSWCIGCLSLGGSNGRVTASPTVPD